MAKSNSGGKRILRATEMFFDRKAILDAVDAAEARVLGKFGSFVRQTARRSIKKPRRKKRSDLSEAELARLGIEENRDSKGRFTPIPVTVELPFTSSRPGQPPFNQTGRLKNSIFFGYDRSSSSVVVGPVRLSGSGQAPLTLEEGGVGPRGKRIKPRPYMRPAFKQELPRLAPLWQNSVKV